MQTPNNWPRDHRFASEQRGKGAGKGQTFIGVDAFPSLPSAGRVGSVPMSTDAGRFKEFYPANPLPPSPPQIEEAAAVWHPPSVEDGVVQQLAKGICGKFIVPPLSPRSYQEQSRRVSGIGAESSRSSFGLPEDRGLSWELQCMRERVLATTRDGRLPEVVQHKYHSLLLLDTEVGVSAISGYPTWVYKALSTTDPFVYCLRRVDGFRLSNFDLVQEAIERWSEIKHPNVVAVRQAFATGEFQDAEGLGEGGSLVYVYDYVDLAQNLDIWYASQASRVISESILWDIAVQLAMALRLIHSRGLATRGCLVGSKILISNRLRIHINCVGLLDALQHPSMNGKRAKSLAELQREDLLGLGEILIFLASGKFQDDDPTTIVARAQQCLAPSLVQLVEACTTSSADEVLALSAAFVAFKAEQLESTQDVLMTELRKGVDVGRLNKILVKVCAIADRVNLLDDWRWASTGDRYIVQLFRDYVFFQCDERGRPFLDSGHITDCLAKVDTGSFEPVMLMNRDGSSVLVTNYNDIRRCIETSFKEIVDNS